MGSVSDANDLSAALSTGFQAKGFKHDESCWGISFKGIPSFVKNY